MNFTWAHRGPQDAGAQSWAEHFAQTSREVGNDQWPVVAEFHDLSDDQLESWHININGYFIHDFFKATSTNLGIIFLLWDVEWMVRAKLSTRKPGNNRKNEHDIGMVPYTSWSIGSNKMELQVVGFKLTTTKPANKLLVPQHTLALILFHVLLVWVPGREKRI